MSCTMKDTMKKEILPNIIWAAIMLPLAFAAVYANKHGYISADTRFRVVAINGLWMAWYGNRLPKGMVPSALARQAKRMAGWSMVLSGLVYAGLFVFAPLPVARVFGTVAVVTGIAITLAYCLHLHFKAKDVQGGSLAA